MAGKMFLGNTAITPVIIKGGEPTSGIQMGYVVDENGALKKQNSGDVVFSGFKSVDIYSMFGGMFSYSSITSFSASELESIGVDAYGCFDSAFQGCETLTSVSFPKLKELLGTRSFYLCFSQCQALKNIDFSSLEKIEGQRSFGQSFGQSAIETISFPKLKQIKTSYIFDNAFVNCDSLTDIYFPALTSSSFGSYKNQFSRMLYLFEPEGALIQTVHFPSNLEATVQGLSGYPYFGGDEEYVRIAFDLPETE